MFTATLFIIVKIQNQPNGPPTDECIKRMWYGTLFCIGKNETLPFITTWMELEIIMLSEIR
jgi:hypothetical protein